MNEALTLLMRGDLFGSFIQVFETAMGLPIFYGFLIGSATLLIYIKTKSYGLVSLTLVLTSFAALPMLPTNMHIYFRTAIMIGIGTLAYLAFRSR